MQPLNMTAPEEKQPARQPKRRRTYSPETEQGIRLFEASVSRRATRSERRMIDRAVRRELKKIGVKSQKGAPSWKSSPRTTVLDPDLMPEVDDVPEDC